MTVVACWRDLQGFVWLAADTRISSVGQGGGQIVKTDSGAKLSSIQVSCNPTHGGQRNTGTYSTVLGFGFAGSVLPAVMTALTASSLMSNMSPMTPNLRNPGFLDLVEPIRAIGERFMSEQYSALPSKESLFECFVTGFCAQTSMPRAAVLKPTFADNGAIRFLARELDLNGAPVAIGSGASEFDDRYAEKENLSPKGGLGRNSMFVVEDMASAGKGDVGGSLSLGYVNAQGFKPTARIQTASSPSFFFNGIDVLEELPWVAGGYTLFSGAM